MNKSDKIGLFVITIVVLLLAISMGFNAGYQIGQIDYIHGKIKYHIVTNSVVTLEQITK
jgi:hypothetical protein